jgi:hypothetical protein
MKKKMHPEKYGNERDCTGDWMGTSAGIYL